MNIDTWKDMMKGGSKNTAKVIAQLISNLKDTEHTEYLNQVIMLSSRQKDLKSDVMNEFITEEKYKVSQIKINRAVLFTLDQLLDDDIILGEASKEPDQVKDEAPKNTNAPASSEPPKEATIDDLKKSAKETQTLLFSLQNEKEMTMPGKAEIILGRQIEEAEAELNTIKDKIRNLTN